MVAPTSALRTWEEGGEGRSATRTPQPSEAGEGDLILVFSTSWGNSGLVEGASATIMTTVHTPQPPLSFPRPRGGGGIPVTALAQPSGVTPGMGKEVTGGVEEEEDTGGEEATTGERGEGEEASGVKEATTGETREGEEASGVEEEATTGETGEEEEEASGVVEETTTGVTGEEEASGVEEETTTGDTGEEEEAREVGFLKVNTSCALLLLSSSPVVFISLLLLQRRLLSAELMVCLRLALGSEDIRRRRRPRAGLSLRGWGGAEEVIETSSTLTLE